MNTPPRLFTPLQIGNTTLPNRIIVSPMCQYSAVDGSAIDWHLMHLGSLAISGAGLLFTEATAVNAQGRITPGCLGLYSDENQQALQRVVRAVRTASAIPLGIQLAHAGRKGSCREPWNSGAQIARKDGGWECVAPSAVPHSPEQEAPRAMDAHDLREVADAFVQAALRARALGFQVIELHMAHGYLLHEFLSPVSNQRDDAYGGALENRMRFPLEVFRAVHAAVGADIPVGARLSATDWVEEGGWDLEQTLALGRRLEAAGASFLDISSGGASYQQQVKPGPGYQIPFAAAMKRAVRIPVIGVGLITGPQQAENILVDDKADAVALARAFLFDPRWPWRAAAELGATVAVPQQYMRALPNKYPAVFAPASVKRAA